jgi:drug/metabolite transporter (DMT)-like permease
MSDRLKNGGIVLALATFCCLLWGSAYPCVKIGYALFGIESTGAQILFAGYRFTMAGIMTLLLATLYHRHWVIPKGDQWRGIITLGLVQTTAQYIFFYIGLAHTTGVKSAIIGGASNFFTIFLAHFILKGEKLTRNKMAGSILGMAGVVLIQINGTPLDGGFSFLGEGFLLIAGIATAMGSVLTRIFTRKCDAMLLTAYQLMFGGIILIGVGLLMGGSITRITPAGLGMLVYLALLSALAFTIWAILLAHNPVSRIAIYGFMFPIFGVILSGLLLHESFLSLRTLSALASVSAGIWLVNREKISAAEGRRR